MSSQRVGIAMRIHRPRQYREKTDPLLANRRALASEREALAFIPRRYSRLERSRRSCPFPEQERFQREGHPRNPWMSGREALAERRGPAHPTSTWSPAP
jgi:hypothetical protein